MIGNMIASFIFGMIIAYFIFLLKKFIDVRNSLKRITKNNVGRFNLDEKKEHIPVESVPESKTQTEEKEMTSGELQKLLEKDFIILKGN